MVQTLTQVLIFNQVNNINAFRGTFTAGSDSICGGVVGILGPQIKDNGGVSSDLFQLPYLRLIAKQIHRISFSIHLGSL